MDFSIDFATKSYPIQFFVRAKILALKCVVFSLVFNGIGLFLPAGGPKIISFSDCNLKICKFLKNVKNSFFKFFFSENGFHHVIRHIEKRQVYIGFSAKNTLEKKFSLEKPFFQTLKGLVFSLQLFFQENGVEFFCREMKKKVSATRRVVDHDHRCFPKGSSLCSNTINIDLLVFSPKGGRFPDTQNYIGQREDFYG